MGNIKMIFFFFSLTHIVGPNEYNIVRSTVQSLEALLPFPLFFELSNLLLQSCFCIIFLFAVTSVTIFYLQSGVKR